MSVEYKLGKTPSGLYQELSCDKESSAIVRDMSIHTDTDCISFQKRIRDILDGEDILDGSFGSFWSLDKLGCFIELKPYIRLIKICLNQMLKN